MKHEFKAVVIAAVLAIIAAAGQAGAEVSIGVEVVGYTPAQVNWGAGSARLAEAAAAIEEAVSSGDTVRAGEKLENLFSGSGARSGAAPVYLAAAPAVPSAGAVPAAELPKAVFKSALEDLGDIEAGEGRDDGEIEPSKAEGEEGAAEEVEAAADTVEAAPGPLWHTLLAGLLGIIIVLAIISLFPVAPLLMV